LPRILRGSERDKIDVIDGGLPCQDFFDLQRLPPDREEWTSGASRPRFFVLENVYRFEYYIENDL